MVMAGEEDIAFERHEVVVECLDTLQVKVVGRCVENEAVGVLQLHAGYHTAHLFTAGEHVHFLLHLFLLKQHTSQVAFHHHFVAGSVLR